MELTDIDLRSLPSLPLENRLRLPSVPGIYLVIDSSDSVLYIGRSVNIYQRWMGHHKLGRLTGVGQVRIAWVEISDVNLLPDLEEALINHFGPPLNIAKPWKPSPVTNGMKALRQNAGIRLTDVAYHLNVTEGIVRNWESGRTEPRLSFKQTFKLMELYNCSVDDLKQAFQETVASV